MTWMNKWSRGFPLAFAEAHGCTILDVDGHELIDFALGDTGAMAGHSPAALSEALSARVARDGGVTTMMPHEDAQWVGAEMTRRFGPTRWSFTLSATDANRWLLRLARLVTARPRILVFAYSYHGSVDETFVVLDENGRASRSPAGPALSLRHADPTTTTAVCEFNDIEALARELSRGDVAAVLTEPAMTNIGIVLPEPGFLAAVEELCRESDAAHLRRDPHLLGRARARATKAWSLRPDAVTIGKSLGGECPAGPSGSARSWPTGCCAPSAPAPAPTLSTSVASAGPWPATPSHCRRCEPCSRTSSPTTPSGR
jgi:glutamate-1-semialdehyde 2,1-aminomutase